MSEELQNGKEVDNLTGFLEPVSSWILKRLDDSQKKVKYCIPTGFKSLDNILDGGLREGLLVFGGGTSMGKTAFVMQLADQVAQNGNPVVIFSLEMSGVELATRSISRFTCINAYKINNVIDDKAKVLCATQNEIDSGSVYDNKEVSSHFIKALQEYHNVSSNIYIQEGVADISIYTIKDTLYDFMRYLKDQGIDKKPLVIVDYLQIIAPYYDINNPGRSFTDKQSIDKNITTLKRISRDLGLCIIALSSFNRDNYLLPVSMASFKESGGIEYSADIVIGMQFVGMEYTTTNTKDGQERVETENEKKSKNFAVIKKQNDNSNKGLPMDIQLKILKNRRGKKNKTIDFYYYSWYSTFFDKKEYDEEQSNAEVDRYFNNK